MQLQSQRRRRGLDLSRLDIGIPAFRVDEHRHHDRAGNKLVQQLQPLGPELCGKAGHAGDIAARPIHPLDEPKLDRIARRREHDRDRGRRRHGRKRRSGISHDHRDVAADQLGGERRQPVVIPARPAVFDPRVLPDDNAGLSKPPMEGRNHLGVAFRRSAIEESDHRQRRPLRVGDERPSRRAAEEHDELSPPHSGLPSTMRPHPRRCRVWLTNVATSKLPCDSCALSGLKCSRTS